MTPLRTRMLEDLRIRNYAATTIKTYIDLVARFARFFGKSPERLGPEDIRTYQVHLLDERKVSWTIVNQTVCALRFLYRVTLGQDWTIQRIPYARREKKLPVVLSRQEVARLLRAAENLKHRTMLMTAYGCGLRRSEVVTLRIDDIDSSRMVVRVRRGKGRKDRYVPLSPVLLKVLRGYWREYRPADYLFPGAKASEPMRPRSLGKVCAEARSKARLHKGVSMHTLRHNAEWRIMPSAHVNPALRRKNRGKRLGIIRAPSGTQEADRQVGIGQHEQPGDWSWPGPPP
jgi:integrase/recombinase XerD